MKLRSFSRSIAIMKKPSSPNSKNGGIFCGVLAKKVFKGAWELCSSSMLIIAGVLICRVERCQGLAQLAPL